MLLSSHHCCSHTMFHIIWVNEKGNDHVTNDHVAQDWLPTKAKQD